MSSKFLKKVCNDVLSVLNEDIRRTVNKLEGQLYIFNRLVFISVMDSILLTMPYRTLQKEIKDKIKAAVIRYHISSVKQNKVSAKKEKLIQKLIQNLPSEYPKPSKNIRYFSVSSYNDVSKIKYNTGIKFSEELKKYGINARNAEEAASLLSTTGVQLGHGEYGIAVSTAKVARASLVLDRARADVEADTKISNKVKSQRLEALQQLSQKIIEYREKFPLSAKLDKSMIFDSSGNFLTKFIAIISSQSGEQNLLDAVGEAEAIEILKSFFSDPKEIIKIKGSDSIIEAFTKVTVYNFLNVKPSKRVKVKSKVKPQKNVKQKSSGSAKKTATKTTKATIITGAGIEAPKSLPVRKTKTAQPVLNLNALKAQINARLSMTVIKNMGTPALENRTGRFARSVQVTDVIQTSKGFPSIGYDYQKYPYQTFEPGFKQGSAQRDPRTLIDRSIREIASELIVGRFYTRRV